MNSEVKNDELIIYLDGQIDTTNADKIGDEITETRKLYPEGALVLDAKGLKYISSAGLRQILRIKKNNKDFRIINVNNDVYEIFDMTGFSEMMDIQKAYREYNVDGCEVLGEGSNGVVYRINPDTIIKVYKNADALEDIKRERELARTAFVMGINTAIPYDIVKVDDSFGAVFELIDCKSLTQWVEQDPDNIDKYVGVFVDVMKEVHNTDVKPGALPSEKEIVMKWATYLKDALDEVHYQKLVKLINDVPESNKMVHGDLHSNNVHYNKREAILIDMDTIAHGNPVFDWACTYNAYIGFGIIDPKAVERFLKLDLGKCELFFKKAVQKYFGVEDIEDLVNKFKVVGLTRILRRTLRRDPNNKAAIDVVKKQLCETLDKVDSIVI